MKIVQGLLEVCLLLASAQLGSTGRIIQTMGAELPVRLLQGLGHMLQLGCLAVDNGRCRYRQALEHGGKPLQATAVAVIPPASVGNLGDRLQVGLDGGAPTTRDENLHVHHRNHEDLLASGPARLHLMPRHVSAIAFRAHQRHGHWARHQPMSLNEGAGIRELEGEVKLLGHAKLEAIAMVHGCWLCHRRKGFHHFFGVHDEGTHRWATGDGEVVPGPLLQDQAHPSRDNVGLDAVGIGLGSVLLVQILAVMRRLTQHEEARILAKENEALSHFHVSFQPGYAVILSPMDLRGTDACLVLPVSVLVVCTLKHRLVEWDSQARVHDGVVDKVAELLGVLARGDDEIQGHNVLVLALLRHSSRHTIVAE